MESALRTMSPQLMICDEIGSLSDSDAIRESYGSGVPTIVSAHARNVSELRKKEYIKDLIDMGAFSYAVGLSRGVGGFELAVTELLKE